MNLIISTIVLSLIAVLISPLDKKGKIINRLGRIWAIFYLYICHIKIRTRGVENIIEGPCVYMCNHQSVLDIFAIYVSLNVPFKWIAKKELFSIPFLGWAL
ncbi:MAG TPA: lysophospholipid acyltransferase family protein, partial [Syntrophorhabdaceae bacterium]|nr:lysophospholipid acyltransferase family protein [Syntrophorhabdaceae bacterium]